MGTNKCASQAGMTAYGTRRHLYDPKMQTDKPFDQTTISLQMGTNKGASQVSGAVGGCASTCLVPGTQGKGLCLVWPTGSKFLPEGGLLRKHKNERPFVQLHPCGGARALAGGQNSRPSHLTRRGRDATMFWLQIQVNSSS